MKYDGFLHGIFDAASIFGGLALIPAAQNLEATFISVIITFGGCYRAIFGCYDQFKDEK